MLTDIITAICFLCFGAGGATLFWIRIRRRNIAWTRKQLDWWYDHSGRLLQRARNMAVIADRAMARGDWYREYLRNKIILDDPSTFASRRERPSMTTRTSDLTTFAVPALGEHGRVRRMRFRKGHDDD